MEENFKIIIKMAGVNLKKKRRDRFFSGQGLNYFPEVAHEQRGASFRYFSFLKSLVLVEKKNERRGLVV